MAIFLKSILCFGVVTVGAVAHLASSHAFAPNQQTVSDLHVVGQQLAASHKENVQWFKAPRQFQVVDDHPVVRNFVDDAPLAIDEGTSGCGGQGAGSLDCRGPVTIPSGGVPLAELLPHTGRKSIGDDLPRTGFGREPNSGANLVTRVAPMRDGTTTNRLMKTVRGRLLAQRN